MHLHNTETRGLFHSCIIALISLVLAVCFEYFVYGKTLGIGFPLFILLILGLGVCAIQKKQYSPELLLVVLPLLFFSWMVFVRASLLLTVLNVIASILLVLLLADLLTGKKLRDYVLVQYADILVLLLKFFSPLADTLSAIASLRGVHRHSQVVSQILKGVLMAIPVLVIFGLLFASADLLFAKYITDILTLDIDEKTVYFLLRVLLAACFFIGFFSYIVATSMNAVASLSPKKHLHLGAIEVSVFLGAINALFLFFILIQLVYLFGGSENIVSQGFTYSQYARKGFFELITVAVFSFIILWKTELSIMKKENTKHMTAFKVMSAILVFQILLIIVSAFTRLSLYEEAYGFTTLRLYSHVFTIFLSLIFLLLLYKIFFDAREHTFAYRIFLLTTAFLIGMNFLNPDAFIARKNIEYFAGTPDKLDVDYLTSLSADAIPEMIAGDYDRNWFLENQDNYPTHWQSMNIARMREKELLSAKF